MISTTFTTIALILFVIGLLSLVSDMIFSVIDVFTDKILSIILIVSVICILSSFVFIITGTATDTVGIYTTNEEGIKALIEEYSKNPKIKIEYKDNFKEGNIIYEVYEYSCFKGEYEIVIINYRPKEVDDSEIEIDFSSYAED